jgi:hypothetical protein
MGNPVNRKEIDDIVHNVNVFGLTAPYAKRLRVDETSSFLSEICCSSGVGLTNMALWRLLEPVVNLILAPSTDEARSSSALRSHHNP